MKNVEGFSHTSPGGKPVFSRTAHEDANSIDWSTQEMVKTV